MKQETAIVYKGYRRRYFTKDAALASFARAKIRAKCDCELADPERNYYYYCHYHKGDYPLEEKIIKRFVRLYKRICQP